MTARLQQDHASAEELRAMCAYSPALGCCCCGGMGHLKWGPLLIAAGNLQTQPDMHVIWELANCPVSHWVVPCRSQLPLVSINLITVLTDGVTKWNLMGLLLLAFLQNKITTIRVGVQTAALQQSCWQRCCRPAMPSQPGQL